MCEVVDRRGIDDYAILNIYNLKKKPSMMILHESITGIINEFGLSTCLHLDS